MFYFFINYLTLDLTHCYLFLIFQDYKAKLSDFGLAKDGPRGEDTHVSTRVMGIQGYTAPEYIMKGKLM